MKGIYPAYAEQVAFYAVGVHPGVVEDLATLERYRWERGHLWPVATGESRMMSDLKVTIQSTKIAFDRDGMITYREGMGRGDDATWHRVFAELAAGE